MLRLEKQQLQPLGVLQERCVAQEAAFAILWLSKRQLQRPEALHERSVAPEATDERPGTLQGHPVAPGALQGQISPRNDAGKAANDEQSPNRVESSAGT